MNSGIDPNEFVKGPGSDPLPPELDTPPAFSNEDIAQLIAEIACASVPASKKAAFRREFTGAILPAFYVADVAGAMQEMGIDDLNAETLPAWVRLLGVGTWTAYAFWNARRGISEPKSNAGSDSSAASDNRNEQQDPDAPGDIPDFSYAND